MTKACSKCNQVKASDLFPADKRVKDGRAAECRACVVLRVEAWRAANPEKRQAQIVGYRSRHHDEIKERNRNYMAQQRADNGDHVRETHRNWTKTPKGVISNRNAAHKRRGVPLTPEAREWWLSLVDPQCHYCDQPAVEIDHVVPISRGGTGDLSNLVPACRSCNASKNDKTLAEWLGSAGTLTTLAS